MSKAKTSSAKVRKMVHPDAIILLPSEVEQFVVDQANKVGASIILPSTKEAFIKQELEAMGLRAVSVNSVAMKPLNDTETIEKMDGLLHNFNIPQRKFIISSLIQKTTTDFKNEIDQLEKEFQRKQTALSEAAVNCRQAKADLADFENLIP